MSHQGQHRCLNFATSPLVTDAVLAIAILFVLTVASTQSAQAQIYTERVLYSFTGPPDGNTPYSGLVRDAQGNLYGTTYRGGDLACTYGCGTVFKVDATGKETVLYSFNGGDGAYPWAGLVQDAQGNLYGTATEGGASGYGTVFKVDTTGKGTVLYSFTGGGDGAYPWGGLVQDAQGNLYGTAILGGAYGGGTVFKLDTTGKQTVLYNFGGTGGDGASPLAALVRDAQGNLYGTTSAGGAYGAGTVFEVDATGKETVLHTFTGSGGDGAVPYAGLVRDAQGNLYGTTRHGGDLVCPDGGCGTVFKVDTTGKETLLYSFSGKDGAFPEGGLVQDAQGNLYGTTEQGGEGLNCNGSYGCGRVFKVDTTGKETALYTFTGPPDGEFPFAGLVQDAQGNLYGTTASGGTYSGTVFKLTAPAALQFVTVTPCRVVDTRNQNGTFGGPPIYGGTYRSFPIPQGNCNVPTSAAAYSLNVTVVPSGQLGYLTIWPAGENQPLVSTMNSLDGRIKANAAIVPAGSQGAVSVYASNTTSVVLDIDGYFTTSGASTLQFYPLTPCRVLDTRNANGDLGGPYLVSGAERDFPVLESTCNIPSTAQAYSMNFTVAPYQGQSLGYLTVWGQGGSQPVVSTLNNLTATIVANAAIVPAGTGGGIATYPSGNTQLVADIDGYFAPAGSGGLSLYTLTPCRVIDTRKGSGQFSGELTVDVVDSPCAPPSTAQAYVFNATVVPVGGLGYLTLWPDTENKPVVSTLNAIDGAITSNMAIVPNINGKTDAFASGITQLILDISAYFAP